MHISFASDFIQPSVIEWHLGQFSFICKAFLTVGIVTKISNEQDRGDSDKEKLTWKKHVGRNQTKKKEPFFFWMIPDYEIINNFSSATGV